MKPTKEEIEAAERAVKVGAQSYEAWRGLAEAGVADPNEILIGALIAIELIKGDVEDPNALRAAEQTAKELYRNVKFGVASNLTRH